MSDPAATQFGLKVMLFTAVVLFVLLLFSAPVSGKTAQVGLSVAPLVVGVIAAIGYNRQNQSSGGNRQ